MLNYPEIVENGSFLRDNTELRMLDDLQELLSQLEESNLEDSIDKINKINFRAMIIARNICVYAQFGRLKIPLLVRLVSKLESKSDIVNQIVLIQKIQNFHQDNSLLNTLIYYGLIDDLNKSEKYTNNDVTNEKQLKKAIKVDDVEKLKMLFASPTFNINQDSRAITDSS